MNDKDLHNLVRTLRSTEVSTPRYQARLRARLLAQHAAQQTIVGRLFAAFVKNSNKGVIMKKNIIVFGASALVMGLLAVGVVSFTTLQTQPVSAMQLVASATKKSQQLSTDEVARINAQYHEDLSRRLAEAKQNKGLRVLSSSEFASWGQQVSREDPSVSKYLTYNDGSNHRIVIGLGSDDRPLYIVDFDAQLEQQSNSGPATEPAANGAQPPASTP